MFSRQDLDELDEVRGRLNGLAPDYNNPHRFFERRDTIVDRLHRLCLKGRRELKVAHA